MGDTDPLILDVLCVGHAAYDLTFAVDHHPGPDEKMSASDFAAGGGGPAANAAVTVARLGGRAGFAGVLGQDVHGDRHLQELQAAGVWVGGVVRVAAATPLSAVLAQPDGRRALVNYQPPAAELPADAVTLDQVRPRVLLLDGHQPELSLALVRQARRRGIPTLLDAGSRRRGTEALAPVVDVLAASAVFARQLTGAADPERALDQLATLAPAVVITLGARGGIWHYQGRRGAYAPFKVAAVDSTGAGDTFHGALAYGLATGRPWVDCLHRAAAAAALCCTRLGASAGIPTAAALDAFLAHHPPPP